MVLSRRRRVVIIVVVSLGAVFLFSQFGLNTLPYSGQHPHSQPWIPQFRESELFPDSNNTAVLATELTDARSGRPKWIEYVRPSLLESGMWTSIQCLAWHRNRSCAFDHIYYDAELGRFVIALPRSNLGNIMKTPYAGEGLPMDGNTMTSEVDTGVPASESSLRELIRGAVAEAKDREDLPRFEPDIRFFEDESELREWRRSKRRPSFPNAIGDTEPELVAGVTLHLLFFGPMNPGHFLYDSLYPAYVTAVRFGHAFTPMNILPIDEGNTTAAREMPHWSVLEHFGRGRVMLTSELTSPLYSFSRLLVGSRFMGHRNPQRSMAIAGSYSYENALFWFGKRLLAGFDIEPWPSSNLRVDGYHPTTQGCRGVIVDNKRFDADTKSMLMEIAAESKRLFSCDISFLKWEDYTFEQQLTIIARSHVYISSTGTGLTRCHLIKPGGVVVHLGAMEYVGLPWRYQCSYRDVHFAVGSPHLNSVYYPRRLWNIYGRLQREGVIETIRRGVTLLRKGFELPRPYAEGLSPTSETWEHYCSMSDDDCKELVDVQNGNFEPGGHRSADTYICEYCSWVDYFQLSPVWSPAGCRDERGLVIHCPLDFRLYRSLMGADHVAFEPRCYEARIAENQAGKTKLLTEAAAKLNKRLEELSADEAVAAMLMVDPPNCPFPASKELPVCDCPL